MLASAHAVLADGRLSGDVAIGLSGNPVGEFYPMLRAGDLTTIFGG